jgi:hypothetical protein
VTVTEVAPAATDTRIRWLDVVEIVKFEHRDGGRIFVWATVRLPSGKLTPMTVEGRWRTPVVTDQAGRALPTPSLTFELLDPQPAVPS